MQVVFVLWEEHFDYYSESRRSEKSIQGIYSSKDKIEEFFLDQEKAKEQYPWSSFTRNNFEIEEMELQ